MKVRPVTIDAGSGFVRLLDLGNPVTINDDAFVNGWVNFYRVDDYVAVSYFYLDKTSNNLPGLPPVEDR